MRYKWCEAGWTRLLWKIPQRLGLRRYNHPRDAYFILVALDGCGPAAGSISRCAPSRGGSRAPKYSCCRGQAAIRREERPSSAASVPAAAGEEQRGPGQRHDRRSRYERNHHPERPPQPAAEIAGTGKHQEQRSRKSYDRANDEQQARPARAGLLETGEEGAEGQEQDKGKQARPEGPATISNLNSALQRRHGARDGAQTALICATRAFGYGRSSLFQPRDAYAAERRRRLRMQAEHIGREGVPALKSKVAKEETMKPFSGILASPRLWRSARLGLRRRFVACLRFRRNRSGAAPLAAGQVRTGVRDTSGPRVEPASSTDQFGQYRLWLSAQNADSTSTGPT